ncbi:unnamed protein product [Ranitomeya imitator]|uniref:Uncharacterized protein n=1 Tax=Ranitomeya imitator TaxID=111125 RepID=A0ABN9LSJ6_9NEOB|nr:unnamed protein product [Ranitomeya imitator]
MAEFLEAVGGQVSEILEDQEQGSATDLHSFMSGLNYNKSNIRLTYMYDQKKVSFLDVELLGQTDGSIHTDMYRKETSINSLLHASSSHPSSTINAIPIGKFLRARKICRSDELFVGTVGKVLRRAILEL